MINSGCPLAGVKRVGLGVLDWTVRKALTAPVAFIMAITAAANPHEATAQKLTTSAAIGPVYSWSSLPHGHGDDHSSLGFAGELGIRWQAVRDLSVRTGLMYAHFFDSHSGYVFGPCPPEGECPSDVGAVNLGGLIFSVMLHGREPGRRGSAYLFAGPGALVTDSRVVEADVLFGWHGGVGIETRQVGRSLVSELWFQQVMQVGGQGGDWPMAMFTVGVRL